jgi:hypothetical protein
MIGSRLLPTDFRRQQNGKEAGCLFWIRDCSRNNATMKKIAATAVKTMCRWRSGWINLQFSPIVFESEKTAGYQGMIVLFLA